MQLHIPTSIYRLLAGLLAVLGCLSCALSSWAQTDPQFTQYWALPSYYNPAAAGETDFVRIRGAARLQWIGVKHAPRSFALTGDMPLKLFNKRIGLGATATSESLGLFSNITAGLQANYRFTFKNKTYLSAGMQLGLFNTKFKGTEVYIPEGSDYHNPNDPSIPNQDLAGTALDLGVGAWYVHPMFRVGISGQHLLKPSVTLQQEGSDSQGAQEYKTEVGRMAYLMAIGNIPLKNTLFVLQPSLLLKSDFKMFTGEITARATYNKFLFASLGYRLNDGISISAGVEIKNIFVGYAYEYPLSAIGKVSSGSHELVAGYSLKLDLSGKNKNRHRAVRIM